MDSSDCDKEDAIEIGVIGTVSTDLEIGKFEGFDLTCGSTSGLTSGTPLPQMMLFSWIFHHQAAWHTLISLHNYHPCQKKKLQ